MKYAHSFDSMFKEFDNFFKVFDKYVINKSIVDNKLQIEVDLPGVKVGDFKVTVEDSTIYVTGSRKGNKFDYVAHVDKGYDASKVEATLNDGVLLLKAPAYEIPKKNQIVEIQVK